MKTSSMHGKVVSSARSGGGLSNPFSGISGSQGAGTKDVRSAETVPTWIQLFQIMH
jgi:hypothetical protein